MSSYGFKTFLPCPLSFPFLKEPSPFPSISFSLPPFGRKMGKRRGVGVGFPSPGGGRKDQGKRKGVGCIRGIPSSKGLRPFPEDRKRGIRPRRPNQPYPPNPCLVYFLPHPFPSQDRNRVLYDLRPPEDSDPVGSWSCVGFEHRRSERNEIPKGERRMDPRTNRGGSVLRRGFVPSIVFRFFLFGSNLGRVLPFSFPFFCGMGSYRWDRSGERELDPKTEKEKGMRRRGKEMEPSQKPPPSNPKKKKGTEPGNEIDGGIGWKEKEKRTVWNGSEGTIAVEERTP